VAQHARRTDARLLKRSPSQPPLNCVACMIVSSGDDAAGLVQE